MIVLFQIRQQSEEKDQLEQVTFLTSFSLHSLLLYSKVQISGFQKKELGIILTLFIILNTNLL